MIEIICPNNNIQERSYITNILFNFIGISFNLKFSDDVNNYVLRTPTGEIFIEDHFFNYYLLDLSYLRKENIPDTVSWFSAIGIESIPIIFGRNYYKKEGANIFCGLDIFASSFFMLTRWEEFLLGKEETGLCNENLLLMVRCNLSQRPIVNEYCDFLKKMLSEIGIIVPNTQKFSVKLTHDVDRCYLSGIKELQKNLIKMIKNRQYKKANHILWVYIYYRICNKQPFNSFDEFMDLSDKYGYINEFYFKTCEKSEAGYTYSISDSFVLKVIKNIIARGHNIGFHPSENTFKNNSQYNIELNRLQLLVPKQSIIGGRNHGLFCNTQTLNQWNNSEIKFVSNYGFQSRFGFRCGVCYSFEQFDIFKRVKTKIHEVPFLIMDTVMMRRKDSSKKFFDEMQKILDEVIKYNGVLCVNWHTNVINTVEMKKYKRNYVKLLNYIGTKTNAVA